MDIIEYLWILNISVSFKKSFFDVAENTAAIQKYSNSQNTSNKIEPGGSTRETLRTNATNQMSNVLLETNLCVSRQQAEEVVSSSSSSSSPSHLFPIRDVFMFLPRASVCGCNCLWSNAFPIQLFVYVYL